jgi:hypothetical protein
MAARSRPRASRCRAQADGLQDRRRAGLEAVRRVGVGDLVLVTDADHLAAALVRRQRGQRSALP